MSHSPEVIDWMNPGEGDDMSSTSAEKCTRTEKPRKGNNKKVANKVAKKANAIVNDSDQLPGLSFDDKFPILVFSHPLEQKLRPGSKKKHKRELNFYNMFVRQCMR